MELDESPSENSAVKSTMFSATLWCLLAVILCFATFGFLSTLTFTIYILLFIAGFLMVIAHWSIKKSNEILASDDVRLLAYEEPYCGIASVFKNIEQAPQGFKYDRRLTGSSVIDELLQEIIQYFFRDYIHYWYNTISDDERFLYELRQTIQKVIISFAGRTKDVSWVPFLTTRVVDAFATHLRIFRITRERLERTKQEQDYTNQAQDPDSKIQDELDLEAMFFMVESEVEQGVTRGPVCLEDQDEMFYLQDVIEVLLYLLLSPEDFHSKGFRYFLREVIAKSVVLPTVNLVCDPDYVNQIISWLLAKETTFTVDSFLTTIRFSEDIEDIEETKKKVDLEIAKLRSQDSDDSNQLEISIKKQLSSLMYVRKLCVTTIRRLKSGIADNLSMAIENDPSADLLELLSPTQNIPKLSLKEILEDNTSLSYFIEYLGTYNAEHYVFFHLTVEGFRATAIQQLSILAEETAVAQNKKIANPTSESFEQLKQAAANIYEEYISPRASPRIVLDDQLVRKIVKDIRTSEPSGAYFDAAHMAVYKILESPKYYGAFLSSTAYLKALDDMDLLTNNGGNSPGSDDDNVSICSTSSLRFPPDEEVLSLPWTPDCDLRYSALIGQAGVISHEGKMYVNYTVHVCRTTSNGSRNWVVMRRYSDFHDLHMQLREKFPSLTWLNLPAKKTFGNFEDEFIEKRKNQLENYLQPLLDTNLLAQHSGMFELVAGFLEQGDYYKGKSVLSRKMDHIVNPMMTSISNVSRVVRSRADTMTKWTGDLSDSLKVPKNSEKEKDLNIGKLSDGLDQSVDENIPLRILLLLMDEVFDLQHRNQWLRRQIVVILRQIIKVTFGDSINRKIVEYVDYAASAQQVAEYVKHFRDSYWPGGVLSDPLPERNRDVKRRMRMVTKAKMLGGIPDELKRFLGMEVVREGVTRVFDMFQYANLNKRLLYVMSEAFLETLFPDNKFKEIFLKIHTKRN